MLPGNLPGTSQKVAPVETGNPKRREAKWREFGPLAENNAKQIDCEKGVKLRNRAKGLAPLQGGQGQEKCHAVSHAPSRVTSPEKTPLKSCFACLFGDM